MTSLLLREPESVGSLEKQFGLGVGPRQVEYDTLEAGLLRRKAYEAYFGLRKWRQDMTERELARYSQLYAANQCQEGCGDPSLSHCVRGLCECRPDLRSVEMAKFSSPLELPQT